MPFEPFVPKFPPCHHGVYAGSPAGPCRLCELEARVEELEIRHQKEVDQGLSPSPVPWIPIATQQPTESGFYYIHPNPYMDERALWWNSHDKVFQDPAEEPISLKPLNPSHWAPIPAPPRAE